MVCKVNELLGLILKYLMFTLILLLQLCTTLSAQISPGELINAHKDLEGLSNCTKCHELGKKVQSKLCLECHTILKEKINSGKGLHANKGYQNCLKCHNDHQGRNFNPIWWENGQENFDHSLTGYKLEGRHKNIKCRDCHKPSYIKNSQTLTGKSKDLQKTFFGLEQACLSCHVDEHRGQMSKDCLTCHSMEGWKPAPRFDHDKTKYPLTGLHKKVECRQCHQSVTDNKFEKDKEYLRFRLQKFDQCTDCHKDVHRGKFGNNCTKCHSTSGWRNYNLANFNHSQTRYPLQGMHKNVDCRKCHLPGKPLAPLSFNKCMDCHSDVHFSQFADRQQKGACEECHSENGFIPANFTIEDHQKSKYPLQGAHRAVPCILCHYTVDKNTSRERKQFTFKQTGCVDCHTDIHRGEVNKYINQNDCSFCHEVATWFSINFDHSKTNFALEGKHAQLRCIQCHTKVDTGTKNERIQFLKMESICQSCHQDTHLGQFAEKECSMCHSSKNWIAEKFIHNRDSRYKIDGAHLNVKCEGCHKTEIKEGINFVRYKPLGMDCGDCHKGSKILENLKQ